MKKIKKIITLVLIAFFFSNCLFPKTALTITIKQEEDMAREFMRVVLKHYELIKDPMLVTYLNQVGQKIVTAAPPDSFKYKFHLIKQNTYNAFASPAGNIFLNSGLFEALDNEDELAGILAHEIAHAQCRHISQRIERSSKMNLLTLAGIAAGIFLGMGGAATAASAVTVGSMATNQTIALAYSREDEMQADQIGLNYLTAAGYGGQGLLTALKKIRSKQWFGSKQIPTYLMTHPASEARIAYIDTWIQAHRQNTKQQSEKIKTDNYNFPRARTRVAAMYGDMDIALINFKAASNKNPDDPMARYGYGLILDRTGARKEAVSQLKKALEKHTFDPYILTDLGRVYFMDGQNENALNALKGAAAIASDNPETFFYLGRANTELGELTGAQTAFESALNLDPDYADAYYFAGKAFSKQGKHGAAHYHLAIFYQKTAQFKNAVFHLEKALRMTVIPSKKEEIEERLKKVRRAQTHAKREARKKK
ncbi:MAG: M48 family metalloprotease [Deltaproteobacteria bacterium]|nr:M48 family metalloprotease [Deltaproteobacteria bacterium]